MDKTEEDKKYTPEEFAEAFNNLSDTMGYQLVALPSWKQTAHGSFELVIQWNVSELTK